MLQLSISTRTASSYVCTVQSLSSWNILHVAMGSQTVGMSIGHNLLDKLLKAAHNNDVLAIMLVLLAPEYVRGSAISPLFHSE